MSMLDLDGVRSIEAGRASGVGGGAQGKQQNLTPWSPVFRVMMEELVMVSPPVRRGKRK